MDENKKVLNEEELDDVSGGIKLGTSATRKVIKAVQETGLANGAGELENNAGRGGYCPYTEDRTCRMNRNFDGGEFCQECGWRAW